MSELTLTLLRLSFLGLLWVLVLACIAVLRQDLYGTQVTRRVTPKVSAGRAPSRPKVPSPPSPSAAGANGGGRGGSARTLVVTEGSLTGTTIALGQQPIVIGRAPDCTLVLDDDFASGRHAQLSLRQGSWILEDLGSTNGTFLGRSKVQSPVTLDPGTPVRIGRTVLELRR